MERYDRVRDSNGTLNRLWQADFCQLAGKPSDCKYEADGGPTFKDCFDLLTAHSVRPALDQRNLLRWLFFNLYVGNNDTHAKNIAILNTPFTRENHPHASGTPCACARRGREVFTDDCTRNGEPG